MKRFAKSLMILTVLFMLSICASAEAAHDFIDWNFTPTLTERDINPGFSPIINIFMGKRSVDVGKIYGGWSPATSQFLSVWDCMEVEFQVSANGIDPRKLKAAQISLDGHNWYDCKFIENKGFVFRAPLSTFKVHGVCEPKMRIAGQFRDNRLQVFILVFRWTGERELFGVLHFMIKETPSGAEKLGRFDVYSYPSRAIEGVIPAWTEEPRTVYPGEEKLTIMVVGENSLPLKDYEYLLKASYEGNERILRYKIKDHILWIDGKKRVIADPSRITFTSPAQVGTQIQLKFPGQDWSTPQQLIKGHELFLKFMAVKDSSSYEKITSRLVTSSSVYQTWRWGRMNGDPRYLGLIRDTSGSTAEQKAALYFQGTMAAIDMRLHGFTFEEIKNFQLWARQYGVEKRIYKAGEVIDSGMTFGVVSKYRQGPILAQPQGISEIAVYHIKTPEIYVGRVPGIVGPSKDYSGREVPGCCNMIAPPIKIKITRIYHCLAKVVYVATKEPVMITMKSPENPVSYVGFEKPTYETITVALATIVKVTVPDYDFDICVDASDCIDISNVINNNILNEIFNNIAIDITNTINNFNEVVVNLINQILNQNNNANATAN